MKEVIEQIHREFNNSGDVLLREAQAILKQKSSDKALRLESAGFKLAKGVKEGREQSERRAEAERLFSLINDYAMRYPNYRFITDKEVNRICDKYNLVCGPVASYKGFVPEKNLKEIQGFELFHVDKRENELRITSAWNADNFVMRRRFANSLMRKLGGEFIPENHPAIYWWQRGRPFSVRIDGEYGYIEEVEFRNYDTFSICAPAKDMELSGLNKIGKQWFSFTRVEVPDPVVLQPVKGGYLIVTAWGDEASDEDVVNHKMN